MVKFKINANKEEVVFMQLLKERILRYGKNLGNGILKVDGFINHQVDPEMMHACGEELARLFENVGATKILTAEISGIAPAVFTGRLMNLPVVYARKTKPVTMTNQVYLTLAQSHTKGHTVELIVSAEYLGGGEKILIIDDFLASGATILALVRLIEMAGSELVGIGALVEKTFEDGRNNLEHLNVPIISLAAVTKMEGENITID
jgi:xanthine phosphoribosyltransferase